MNYYILPLVISISVEIFSENDRKYPKIMIICKIFDIPPLEVLNVLNRYRAAMRESAKAGWRPQPKSPKKP